MQSMKASTEQRGHAATHSDNCYRANDCECVLIFSSFAIRTMAVVGSIAQSQIKYQIFISQTHTYYIQYNIEFKNTILC